MFNKKAQLGIIQFKFAIIGFIAGVVLMIVIITLSKNGVLPSLPFL